MTPTLPPGREEAVRRWKEVKLLRPANDFLDGSGNNPVERLRGDEVSGVVCYYLEILEAMLLARFHPEAEDPEALRLVEVVRGSAAQPRLRHAEFEGGLFRLLLRVRQARPAWSWLTSLLAEHYFAGRGQPWPGDPERRIGSQESLETFLAEVHQSRLGSYRVLFPAVPLVGPAEDEGWLVWAQITAFQGAQGARRLVVAPWTFFTPDGRTLLALEHICLPTIEEALRRRDKSVEKGCRFLLDLQPLRPGDLGAATARGGEPGGRARAWLLTPPALTIEGDSLGLAVALAAWGAAHALPAKRAIATGRVAKGGGVEKVEGIGGKMAAVTEFCEADGERWRVFYPHANRAEVERLECYGPLTRLLGKVPEDVDSLTDFFQEGLLSDGFDEYRNAVAKAGNPYRGDDPGPADDETRALAAAAWKHLAGLDNSTGLLTHTCSRHDDPLRVAKVLGRQLYQEWWKKILSNTEEADQHPVLVLASVPELLEGAGEVPSKVFHEGLAAALRDGWGVRVPTGEDVRLALRNPYKLILVVYDRKSPEIWTKDQGRPDALGRRDDLLQHLSRLANAPLEAAGRTAEPMRQVVLLVCPDRHYEERWARDGVVEGTGETRAIEHGQTLLCDHVAGVLQRGADLILPLSSALFNPDGSRTAVDYFCDLYIPLGLVRRGGERGRVGDLSHTLLELARRKQPGGGLVVRGPVGSGKTLAALKAFFDCCVPLPDADGNTPARPLLAPFLPCWVPLKDADGDTFDGLDVGLDLFDRLVFSETRLRPLRKIPRATFEEILSRRPPLLLFVDLDDFQDNDARRGRLYRALQDWRKKCLQKGWPHVCVVLQRSTASAEARFPSEGKLFDEYDLQPSFSRDQVRRYCERVSLWAHPDADESRRRLLRENLDRVLASPEAYNLAQNPLYLHFLSTIAQGQGVGPLQTLSDLYGEVLRQQAIRASGVDVPHFPRLAQTGCTRIALAMHAQGKSWLRESEARRVALNPRQYAGSGDDWEIWRRGETQPHGWDKWAYFTGTQDTPLSDSSWSTLVENSPLRFEPGPSPHEERIVSFHHPSFRDYFVGAFALGAPVAPEWSLATTPPPEGWHAAVASLHEVQKYSLVDAFRFLGGALPPTRPRDLLELLERLACRPPRPEIARLSLALIQGSAPSSWRRELVQSSDWAGWRSLYGPAAFLPELYALAGSSEHEDLVGFGQRLWDRARESSRTWLRLDRPALRLCPETRVDAPVASLDCLTADDVLRVYFATASGEVWVWDASRGRRNKLFSHARHVTALRIAPCGTGHHLLLLADDRGVLHVRRLNDNLCADGADFDHAFGETELSALDVDPAGGGVAVGDEDGKVYFWDLTPDAPHEVLTREKAAVTALSFLGGRHLIVGNEAGCVRMLWRRDGETWRHGPLVAGHADRVNAVLVEESRVLTGGEDGSLTEWRWERESLSLCGTQRFDAPIKSLATHRPNGERNGKHLVGLDDGSIVSLDPESSARAAWGNEVGGVRCLKDAQDKGVLTLISGAGGGRARLWPRESGPPRSHRDRVNALASLGDRVWSGSEDGSIFSWDAHPTTDERTDPNEGGQWSPIKWHTGLSPIQTLLALPSRRILAGTSDGTLILIDPDSKRLTEVARHAGGVTALIPFGAGTTEFLSADDDGGIFHWSVDREKNALEVRRAWNVPSRAAILGLRPWRDGRFLSFSDDRRLRRWSCGSTRPEVELPVPGDVVDVVCLGPAVHVLAEEESGTKLYSYPSLDCARTTGPSLYCGDRITDAITAVVAFADSPTSETGLVAGTAAGQLLRPPRGGEANARTIRTSPLIHLATLPAAGRNFLLSVDRDSFLGVWRLMPGGDEPDPITAFPCHSRVHALLAEGTSSGGRPRVVAGLADGTVLFLTLEGAAG